MAEKKTATKKAASKQTPLEALQKAVEAARKAGVLVKGFATHNTEEESNTVRL